MQSFCDKDGATQADYLDAKRRKVQEDGGPVQALGGAAPSGLQYNTEEDWDDNSLRNLGWWDNVDYQRDVLHSVPTVGSVPRNMMLAAAEARLAVLREAKAMNGSQSGRALKLLFFMDRLLFAQPAGVRGERACGKYFGAVLSTRLCLFCVATGTPCG